MLSEHTVLVCIIGMLCILICILDLIHRPICWLAGTYTAYPYKRVDAFGHVPSDTTHASNLEVFNTVAQKEQLEFWVSEGSALGLVRSGDLIAGDSDVDVGIYATAVEPLKRVIDVLTSSHGFRVWRNSPLSIIRSGAYIDIDITERGQPCMAVSWPSLCDEHMDTLEPFQFVQYRDCTYKVPSETYFIHLYGSDWRVPKPGFKPNMITRKGEVAIKRY
jgi:hypothetical protein